jgi:SAM-dependent methyltransferase
MVDGEADPKQFYDDYGAAEWDRLSTGIDGDLEFEFTTDELVARLPPEGHVLDAGGGAGRYAVWLAERGYDVTLVDVSSGQLTVADEKRDEYAVDDRLSMSQQSITDLGFDPDTFDATLCLGGPLSHLLDVNDRERAVRELGRVTRPGAPVFVSVMGLLGFIQLKLLTGHNVGALPDLLVDGNYDDDLLAPLGYENEFTATHFFRRRELVALLEDRGIDVSGVTGLEGLGSFYHDATTRDRIADLDQTERDAIIEVLDDLRTDPAVTDLSVHMLAIGRA